MARRWVRFEMPVMVCVEVDEDIEDERVVDTEDQDIALARDSERTVLVYDELMERAAPGEPVAAAAISVAVGGTGRRSVTGDLGRMRCAIRMINSFGNLSGFVGPYLTGWPQSTTGSFRPGLWVVAGFMVLAGVIALSFRTVGTRSAQIRDEDSPSRRSA